MLVLNLGCGINRNRFDGTPFPAGTIHIDHNPGVGADIVADLNSGLPTGHTTYTNDQDTLGTFTDLVNTVDEIHAYHVIEHIGKMGETYEWFTFWRSCWKALKPDGIMFVVAPFYLHESAIGDPTHSRLICGQTFHFLDREAYKVGANDTGSSMSKLSIDFDLPTIGIRTITKPGETIPHTILAGLQARKTQDGHLIGSESKVMEAV